MTATTEEKTTEEKTKAESTAAATETKMSDQEKEALEAVKTYTYWSLTLGILPTFVDYAALAALHQKLVHRLAKIYGKTYNEQLAKSAVSGLFGLGVAHFGVKVLNSVLKIIPGIGSITGVASMSVMAGATTYALGRVFIQHFETGGTLLTFDAAKIREFYEQELQNGKQVSQRISWAGIKP